MKLPSKKKQIGALEQARRRYKSEGSVSHPVGALQPHASKSPKHLLIVMPSPLMGVLQIAAALAHNQKHKGSR